MLGQRNRSAAGQAVGEVERCSWIAGPEGVAAAAEFCARHCHLGNRMHRKGAGALEPQLISRALEKCEEGSRSAFSFDGDSRCNTSRIPVSPIQRLRS